MAGKFGFLLGGEKTFARKLGKVNNPNTVRQQEVRSRFLVAIRFYQQLQGTALKHVLNISVRGISTSGYAFYMRKNLMVFRADGSIGDFSQLQFSAGRRQRAYNLFGEIDERGEVTLRWENDLRVSSSDASDLLQVIVLHEGRSFSPGGGRCECGEGGLHGYFSGGGLEGGSIAFVSFFASPSGNQLSESQHVCLHKKE